MECFRYVLLMAIVVLSGMIGMLISKRYSDRVKELIEMKKALNIFKTKVKFTYEPIPEILSEMSRVTSGCVSDIFEDASLRIKDCSAQVAWEMSVEESVNNSLTDEDKEVIKTLAKELRKGGFGRAD